MYTFRIMLKDTLKELIEIYLCYAGVNYDKIDAILALYPDEVEQLEEWLHELAPERLTDEQIDNMPLEWE